MINVDLTRRALAAELAFTPAAREKLRVELVAWASTLELTAPQLIDFTAALTSFARRVEITWKSDGPRATARGADHSTLLRLRLGGIYHLPWPQADLKIMRAAAVSIA
jgi:hypothetical protein